MVEAFVKIVERDYVSINDRLDATTVLSRLKGADVTHLEV